MTYFLLMLNLLVLAIGVGAQYLVAGLAPELNEFNAGKIRFWSQPDAYQPAPAAKPDDQAANPAAQTSVCLEITGLSQARYQDMRARLKSVGLDGGPCSYHLDKGLGWWVFWPPEYEAAQRDKVIKAIQAAGIKDVQPIAQGAMAQAYSLGVFVGEKQANRFRDELRGKGLDKVDFGPRPNLQSGRLGCQSDDAAKLAGLTANLPTWATRVEVQQCGLAGGPEAGASGIRPPRR
ncbi:MAG: hypothetical protein PHR30_01030 [Gallionellaceae bacterium]|nr:hypothetical protein [Gallionellaceae bacterium]MDD5363894.1 hypothetical protein [Gallionellaceae bacterium]